MIESHVGTHSLSLAETIFFLFVWLYDSAPFVMAKKPLSCVTAARPHSESSQYGQKLVYYIHTCTGCIQSFLFL